VRWMKTKNSKPKTQNSVAFLPPCSPAPLRLRIRISSFFRAGETAVILRHHCTNSNPSSESLGWIFAQSSEIIQVPSQKGDGRRDRTA
jgi:hypothetical protein